MEEIIAKACDVEVLYGDKAALNKINMSVKKRRHLCPDWKKWGRKDDAAASVYRTECTGLWKH